MVTQPKQPRRRRFTLASLYLALGIGVGYLVLTRMVPAMHAIAEGGLGAQRREASGWEAFAGRLSLWVVSHPAASKLLAVGIALAGFLLPIWVRSTRYLVWLLALAVFLLDVGLAGAGYWSMISRLLQEAQL
jgi:hypothetical protein